MMSDHPRDLQCPKCQSKMTPGYEATAGFGAPWNLQWAKRLPTFLGIPGPNRSVLTYCCDACGYLESYSLPPNLSLKDVLGKP